MSTRQPVTRRKFVNNGLSLLAVLSPRVLPARAAPATPPRRSEVHSDAARSMLLLYKQAITEMKSRPPWEPTSWWFQANLHFLPATDDPHGCYQADCFNTLF